MREEMTLAELLDFMGWPEPTSAAAPSYVDLCDSVLSRNAEQGVPGRGCAALPARSLPYPGCTEPIACSAKGYCVRDPNCGQ